MPWHAILVRCNWMASLCICGIATAQSAQGAFYGIIVWYAVCIHVFANITTKLTDFARLLAFFYFDHLPGTASIAHYYLWLYSHYFIYWIRLYCVIVPFAIVYPIPIRVITLQLVFVIMNIVRTVCRVSHWFPICVFFMNLSVIIEHAREDNINISNCCIVDFYFARSQSESNTTFIHNQWFTIVKMDFQARKAIINTQLTWKWRACKIRTQAISIQPPMQLFLEGQHKNK